jgi:DNA-binding NarL/FixJ family response regulator
MATVENSTVAAGLVLMGGTPVLNVGVVTALQTDPRLQFIPHVLSAEGAAIPVAERAFDVLALLTDAPMPLVLQDWERLDPGGGPRRLLLRRQVSPEDALAAIQAGLRGYAVLAPLLADDLVAGIVLLARYGIWLCPLTTQMLLSSDQKSSLTLASQPPMHINDRHALLSEQELTVLRLGSAGLNEAMIAEQMSLAQNTVKTYWRRIRTKLDVDRRSDAIVRGIELGMVRDRRRNSGFATDTFIQHGEMRKVR